MTYARRVTDYNKNRAVLMWNAGADTIKIAEVLGHPEWQIYNNLRKWRGVDENSDAA